MRILVTGAYGFIGSQITSTLKSAGHIVVCCVRDVSLAKKHFPSLEVIECDFRKDILEAAWISRLDNIDAVVNCVGILQSRTPGVIKAIHYDTPVALFQACIKTHKKFIHISAMGADEGVDTLYAKTKLNLEKYISNQIGDWVILRPSLVYGSGSFGGTSLFRALASLPWIIPVVGDGKQTFQPIQIHDLAKTVQIVIEDKNISQKTLNVVGPDKIASEQLLVLLRDWLGFGKARVIHIPLWVIKPLARMGDWFPDIPINSTSFTMLNLNNVADPAPLLNTVGFKPLSMQESLSENPSSVQDRWHARLYFLDPLLRITLGLFWILSGLIPILGTPHQEVYELLSGMGISGITAKWIFYSCSLLDITLGAATLLCWKIKWVGCIQLLLIFVYTLLFTFLQPIYWLDPLGTLLKNIPIMLSTLIMIALSEKR